VREIVTTDPELEQLQTSIKEALADLQAALAFPLGKPTAPVRSRYVARFGEAVMADPSEGAFSIILKAANEEDIGKLIAIKNNSASTNTITIVAARDGTIDGAASTTMTTAWDKAIFQAIAKDEYVTL
jgi:hypothetical protein